MSTLEGESMLTRRSILITGAGAVAGLLVASPASATPAGGSTFLSTRFDQYGSGSTLRLPQSYTGGYFGSIGFVSSFTYDNALVILAWLASGSAADLQRATVLGDTLLYAQAHDPYADGRTRASYQPDPFITADGSPQIGSPAANTGNQAWAGIALARLHEVTGQARFLQGALRLADWIQTFTYDVARAPYGYTGGRDGGNAAYTFKSTEHNIDVGAFFTMLATLTGDTVWTARAQTAFGFVAAMQNTATGYVWTGTNADGRTVNPDPIPADVQTWAYLATGDSRYSAAVTWANTALAVTDSGYAGIAYSTADTSKVWFEGTAQLALALRARGATGDPARYTTLITTCENAQARHPNGDGNGLVAASRDGLDTGFGDLYYASLHTGATAWYLLAAKGYNPFAL
jgi:hypothetical protein